MGRVRSWLQHHLNGQHVRCRLHGLADRVQSLGAWLHRAADRVAAVYDHVTRPLLYGRRKC